MVNTYQKDGMLHINDGRYCHIRMVLDFGNFDDEHSAFQAFNSNPLNGGFIMKKILGALLLLILILVMLSGCGNPSRKGDTTRCTICGSNQVVYSSTNYGYCSKHFNDMINYKK